MKTLLAVGVVLLRAIAVTVITVGVVIGLVFAAILTGAVRASTT